MSEVRHIEAILLLAEKAMSKQNWHEDAGTYRALLSQSLPYLRRILEELIANEVTA